VTFTSQISRSDPTDFCLTTLPFSPPGQNTVSAPRCTTSSQQFPFHEFSLNFGIKGFNVFDPTPGPTLPMHFTTLPQLCSCLSLFWPSYPYFSPRKLPMSRFPLFFLYLSDAVVCFLPGYCRGILYNQPKAVQVIFRTQDPPLIGTDLSTYLQPEFFPFRFTRPRCLGFLLNSFLPVFEELFFLRTFSPFKAGPVVNQWQEPFLEARLKF